MLCANCIHYNTCINRILDDAYACDEGISDVRRFKNLADIDVEDWFDNLMIDINENSLRISFFKNDHYKDEKIIPLPDFIKN